MKRVLAAAGILAGLCLGSTVQAQISYQNVRSGYGASDVLVLDHQGRLLQRLRTDFAARRGDWTELQDVSPALQRAIILAEDRRFQEHEGVDWRAVWSAAWRNVSGEAQRGASTLSMQLLGFIDEDYRRGPRGRSVMQKFAQLRAALELEQRWTKHQILEAYLNMAPFRGEIVGIDALSQVLFRKAPSGLDARESALAAVLLRGPNAGRAVLVRRACAVLADMGRPGECADLPGFIEIALARSSGTRGDADGIAPHFSRAVLAVRGAVTPGRPVRTTMDFELQTYALAVVERSLLALRSANVHDAALVVQDNESGKILAYVGSSGELSSASQVDHARAMRQAGSTLKPFLYAQALEEERLTTVSLLDDSPLSLPTGNGLYIPQNYDKRFSGWVSVRHALASSLNIPAVRALMMVTPDAFASRLLGLDLPLQRSGDYYGYSLALGSADVTLLALTNAYRALARGGVYSSPRMLPDRMAAHGSQRVATADNDRRAFHQSAAWIVGDILSDRQARARTFGLDSSLSTPFWSAVKTGTSKDMRDNWCIGWSSKYTVGVWVGNSTGISMRDVSGVSGAGPIWHDIMMRLHRDLQSVQPTAPPDVRRERVSFEGELEPARTDYFVGDTAVNQVRLAVVQTDAEQALIRIHSPAEGTILALDPDIPASRQRMVFRLAWRSRPTSSAGAWYVNGEMVGRGDSTEWSPVPGRHRIEVKDADGRVRDMVRILVRPGNTQ